MKNIFNATSIAAKFHCAYCGFETAREWAVVAHHSDIPYISPPQGWLALGDGLVCPLHDIQILDDHEAIDRRREMKLRIEYGA